MVAGVALADGGDGVRVEDAALEEIDAAVEFDAGCAEVGAGEIGEAEVHPQKLPW